MATLAEAIMENLPALYIVEFGDLIQSVRATTDIEEKKKIYDTFSQKYTTPANLWKRRIALELPPDDLPITKEIYDKCLKLRRKAMKHFHGLQYLPDRVQKLCESERTPKLEKVYRFRSVILRKAFSVGSCKLIEPFLTFPHSQLEPFYRYHQLNSGTPLPADIKEKYDKAVESYRQMILIAMEPNEWTEWMKSNFSQEDWTANFECKLAEHFYMNKIWLAYIKFLEEQKTYDVLDVYKRYCRIFVHDADVKHKYNNMRLKLNSNERLQWDLDLDGFYFDFCHPSGSKYYKTSNRYVDYTTKSSIKSSLKKCSTKMCQECFEIKNQRYFNGKLNFDKLHLQKEWFWKRKRTVPLECYLCGESLKGNESIDGEKEEEILVDNCFSTLYPGSIKFRPIVKIQFHDSYVPAIPISIFQYLLENANHQILSKLYATSKYFYVKEQILICYRICICLNPEESTMQGALWTNVRNILKSPIRKYCCGTTLTFKDGTNPNLLSKCLTKLCCCSLTNLIIFGQNLNENEFKYLLQSEKMEYIELKEVRIFKSNKVMMKIEEIIEMLPTVTELKINTKSPQMFSPLSSQRIASLFRNGIKFNSFCLYQVPDTFDLEFFQTLLREHMQLRGYFSLDFHRDAAEEILLEYDNLLEDIKKNWLPAYQRLQF